ADTTPVETGLDVRPNIIRALARARRREPTIGLSPGAPVLRLCHASVPRVLRLARDPCPVPKGGMSDMSGEFHMNQLSVCPRAKRIACDQPGGCDSGWWRLPRWQCWPPPTARSRARRRTI